MLAVLAPATPSVRAAEPTIPYYEVSGGGEVAGPAWSAYSSTTVALAIWGIGASGSIREEGWRLRTGGGYWRYSDRPVRWVPGIGDTRVSLKRSGSFADLLLGYQKSLGALTVKAYAGGIYTNEQWAADGIDDGSPGAALSAKVLVESWLNLTPASFAQLDAGWTSLRDTITARARLGYRVTPALSIGPEAGYWSAVDAETDSGVAAWRYGAFVRFEWNAGEISVSAGSADEKYNSHLYVTANALLRF